MPACAIFLDRDGTINYDPGYIKDPGEVVILPGVAEGIRKLKVGFGFKVIVVSNQAGIAKGLMSHKDVEAVNRRILELLAKEKASVDAFYYCPFHPDFDPPEKTDCRKPSPFMIVKSAKDHEIDLSRSYMIGDKAIDVLSGINAGVKTVLIRSNSLEKEISTLHNQGKKPNFVAANFKDACDFILSDLTGGN